MKKCFNKKMALKIVVEAAKLQKDFIWHVCQVNWRKKILSCLIMGQLNKN